MRIKENKRENKMKNQTYKRLFSYITQNLYYIYNIIRLPLCRFPMRLAHSAIDNSRVSLYLSIARCIRVLRVFLYFNIQLL